MTGRTDWTALRTLYTALATVAPSYGARIALAAVTGRLDGPAAGLERLAALIMDDPRIEGLQPFHATRADLLARAGATAEAVAAFDRAIELTSDPAVRSYLTGRRDLVRSAREA